MLALKGFAINTEQKKMQQQQPKQNVEKIFSPSNGNKQILLYHTHNSSEKAEYINYTAIMHSYVTMIADAIRFVISM